MNRQNLPCANLKINGCTGLVNQRGNILCETCTETRKTAIQNKREFDFDALMVKYRELDSELSKCKLDLENSEVSRNTLLEEKKRAELNNSQLQLDNEKLSIDNQQLKILNESLKAQNDLLTKQIGKTTETVPSAPQTARTRGLTVFSKIPGLKTKK
jgi:hypothetical protein